MKKILLPILLACAMALPLHGQTILVIDVNGVFNNLTEVKTEIAKLKSAVDEYNGYLNDQGKIILDMQSKVAVLQQQAQNPALTPESRDQYQHDYNDQLAILNAKSQDIQKVQATSNGIIQQAQENLVKTQLDKIRTEVGIIAAKRGATLVLNKANMGMISSVMYNDAKLDISDEVQTALNAAAAAAAPATAAPAATGMAPATKTDMPMSPARPASTSK